MSAEPLPPGGLTLGELEALAAEVWGVPSCYSIAERSARVVKIVATLYGSASNVKPEEARIIRERLACRPPFASAAP